MPPDPFEFYTHTPIQYTNKIEGGIDTLARVKLIFAFFGFVTNLRTRSRDLTSNWTVARTTTRPTDFSATTTVPGPMYVRSLRRFRVGTDGASGADTIGPTRTERRARTGAVPVLVVLRRCARREVSRLDERGQDVLAAQRHHPDVRSVQVNVALSGWNPATRVVSIIYGRSVVVYIYIYIKINFCMIR